MNQGGRKGQDEDKDVTFGSGSQPSLTNLELFQWRVKDGRLGDNREAGSDSRH